ncbi:MAG: YHYH protein [Anaerolineales bacterium]|nr:YHYH protein [Anaerolineales bacterium]
MKRLFILLMISFLLTACLFPPPPAPQTGSDPSTESQPEANDQSSQNQNQPSTTSEAESESYTHSDAPHTSDVDATHLEIGDGKYSTTPQVGYVFSCQTNYNGQGATGAPGNWINGDGTWNALMKAVVDGSVSWPHSFSISIQGDGRVFTGNGLPDHTTGNYPISPSDDAYAYDRNPNSISEQNITLTLPANPTIAAQPTCVGGDVGIMLSGVVLFNAFDALGRDAQVHEVQDECDGHPQQAGVYHYHALSDCLEDTETGHSALMGYAFDGFGIYGYYDEDGTEITNEDLDECHGHVGVIEWDGQSVEMYHYHATREFPYTVGCFKGTPSVRSIGGQGQNQQPQQGEQNQNQGGGQTGQQPPQEAIDACVGLSQGASCSVGNMTGTCMTPPNSSQLACVPAGGPPP